MAHSPAPWHADEHMRVVGANGDVICDVDPFDEHPDAKANLALIAAAPELLHALKAVMHGNDNDDSVPAVQARAAIAKAEAA
jgi:hypothetical protein